METIKIRDGEEFIKLGQAMKKAGLVGSGLDAKILIQDGQVKVNGEVDTRRGKKLYPGDSFEYDGNTVKVEE
ncbi:MAG: RNA-binding S4 domain-containing protein [Eubacterium sp.]|jgi:ribosome-associated protein|nr:RNA-binding S4 domain-containing protein [Eubacterium sp.]